MHKSTILATLTAGLALTIGTGVVPAKAATKVPSAMRHSWYQPFKDVKDPMFIKFSATSIDTGSKGYHNKIAGKKLQVIKKKSGWYQIGAAGISNPTYKVTKLKVDGKKRTVLLKKFSKSSHYADVYVNGTKTKITVSAANHFLG